MKQPIIPTFLLAVALSTQVHAANLSQAYLDDSQNVHVVTTEGRDLKLTAKGHGAKVMLSPDGESAVWLVNRDWTVNSEHESGASELAIYRQGHIRSIKCEPFIRDYWFWRKGSRIAIDCGGRHFAGREILYDIRTLRMVDSFDQATVPVDERPSWSASGSRFESD